MALAKAPRHDDLPRGSAGRAVAELNNANNCFDFYATLAAAGSAIAGTATKAKTVNSITYLVAGAFYTLAGTDNFWTLGVAGSNTALGVSSWQKYALLVDSTGTATVQEATPSTVSAAAVTWTNVSNVTLWAPYMSMVNGSTGKSVVAVMTVATDSTHTFTPGTTALNAAGITTTFQDGIDISLLPLVTDLGGNIYGQNV